MLVEVGPWRAAEMRPVAGQSVRRLQNESKLFDVALVTLGFSGTYSDWCEEGFSICEAYLIEAQNFFLHDRLDGFLAMAAAQFDAELADETLAHANALLADVRLYRSGDGIEVVKAPGGNAGLNWLNIVSLCRAMETTKGDMRMPRMHPAFERILRKALVLS